MKAEELVKYLPEKPSKKSEAHLKKEAHKTHLSREYLVFKSEIVKSMPSYLELLESDSQAGMKSERVAHCICTACGNEFDTGWLKADERTHKGIEILQGEDGHHYDGFDFGYKVKYNDGDMLTCPYCDEKVQLYHSSHLIKPKINQVAISEVINIRKQTVIMTWLAKREINRLGKSIITFEPFGAVALIDKKLYSYKHFKSGFFGCYYPTIEWYKTSRFTDPTECIYFDSGSWNNKAKGHIMCSSLPEMKGTSGEKTGLSKYIKEGGQYPAEYLRLWKRHPNVENLIMTGWHDFVITSVLKIREGTSYYMEKLSSLNWKKKKPHEIMHMSKAEYKYLAQFKWTFEQVVNWRKSQILSIPIKATEFNSQICSMQSNFLPTYCRYVEGGNLTAEDYRKTVAYLQKQKRLNIVNGLQYLVDHRLMLRDFNESNGIYRELTEEERFPKSLFDAHEEDIRRIKEIENSKLQKAFDKIYEMFSEVQWTDGDLCVVIPKSETELKREGAVLRHCVGSYGKQHTEKKLIFFIRHYRRPERSYYTLNIDCTGEFPKEIQLHGYGNERHGKNKEYEHRIPDKVRAFVDRWEKEVLLPWYKKEFKKAA